MTGKKIVFFILITSLTLLVAFIGIAMYWANQLANQAVPTAPVVDWTAGSHNELVILHLNQPVTNEDLGLILTLQLNDTDHHVIAVADATGQTLGTVEFTSITEVQTLDQYQFKLQSATTSAAQVVVYTTTVDE